MGNIRLIILVLMTFFAVNVFGDEKGESIMKKYYSLPKSNDTYAVAKMILITKTGAKKIREIKYYTLETAAGTNTFIEFLSPADVRGTKFLTIGKKTGNDDQRLYMPALKKIRKISSSGKDGKFMGSDIYFYDMEDREYDDSRYRYIKDEVYNGKDSWVIESIDKDPEAPYSKSILWVSKADNFVYKTMAYDKKGKLLKTIVMVEVKKIKGIMVTLKMAVDNHKDNHKTLLSMTNIKVNSGVDKSLFTIQNLQK